MWYSHKVFYPWTLRTQLFPLTSKRKDQAISSAQSPSGLGSRRLNQDSNLGVPLRALISYVETTSGRLTELILPTRICFYFYYLCNAKDVNCALETQLR